MSMKGFAPNDVNGKPLGLHYIGQHPTGQIVEMPAIRNNVNNRVQHPLGNKKGVWLSTEQRAAFNTWRENYWKARAIEELQRRGITL